MTAIRYLKLYLLTVPVFLAIDAVWLGVLAREFYAQHLGYLNITLNLPAAIVFYLLFVVGIIYFAVAPALKEGSFTRATLNGLLFGLFTYATYDLTNLATLPNWPLTVVVADILWGMALCASVATLSYLIGRRLQDV